MKTTLGNKKYIQIRVKIFLKTMMVGSSSECSKNKDIRMYDQNLFFLNAADAFKSTTLQAF